MHQAGRIGFVGAGGQWLALRNQVGECVFWPFMSDNVKPFQGIHISRTFNSTPLSSLLPLLKTPEGEADAPPSVIATTMRSYPVLLCVGVAPDGRGLEVDSISIEGLPPQSYPDDNLYECLSLFMKGYSPRRCAGFGRVS